MRSKSHKNQCQNHITLLLVLAEFWLPCSNRNKGKLSISSDERDLSKEHTHPERHPVTFIKGQNELEVCLVNKIDKNDDQSKSCITDRQISKLKV